MELTRRSFFKTAAAALVVSSAYELSTASQAFAVEAGAKDWKLANTEEYTNICCYCAGGFGSLLSVRNVYHAAALRQHRYSWRRR